MKLDHALRVNRGEVVSFIGAGGKTSALFCLGRELAARGWRVLATTSTRVAADEILQAPFAMVLPAAGQYNRISEALDRHGFVFLYGRIEGDKAIGIDVEQFSGLLDRVSSDVLLVEADGARRLPLKAPFGHEPVLPSSTTRVVLCAGMDVLDQPLDALHVYNPDAIQEHFGFPAGQPVLWPWVGLVLRDPELGLARVPDNVPVFVLLNKTPREGYRLRQARLTASVLLRSPRISGVVIGSVRDSDPVIEVRCPVGAIVLAAGLSSRMGESKVLLPWGKERVLEAILRRLFVARLDQIVVVTGRDAGQVNEICRHFGVDAAHNPDFAKGEMLSSLQVGLQAMGQRVNGALIVLGDQPQMQGRVLSQVLAAYAQGNGSIVAPSYEMRRGHPILIGREHWQALLELPAGRSPRDVINARPNSIAYVTVENDSILRDIDTPEDYIKALREAGLRVEKR